MKKSSMILKGVFTLLLLITISISSKASDKGKVKFYNISKGFGMVVNVETGVETEFTTEPGADLQIGDDVIIITITNNNGDVRTIVASTQPTHFNERNGGVVTSTQDTH
jgi:hypothetical protein